MSKEYNTLRILDELRKELDDLLKLYKENPTVALYNEIIFLKSKIAQYTERAEQRMP